jgi:hypothetical protein
MKNNGSGEVWWTGGDSDKEGFRELVIRRLMSIEGVTKVTCRQEVPPDRESEVLGSGAPLWDEVWLAAWGRLPEAERRARLDTLAAALGHLPLTERTRLAAKLLDNTAGP